MVSAIMIIVHHHLLPVVGLPIIGAVLWLCFKGRRAVKARLEGANIPEFTRTLGPR